MLREKPRNARTVVKVGQAIVLVTILFMAVASLSFTQREMPVKKVKAVRMASFFKTIPSLVKKMPVSSSVFDTPEINKLDKDIVNLVAANVRWANTRGDSSPDANDLGVLTLEQKKLQAMVNIAQNMLGANSDKPIIVVWEHNGVKKWVTKKYYDEEVPIILAEEKHQQERAAMIARIDGYLASRGSPMKGLGWAFYDSAARYQIDPRLSVAIAEGESSCGLACFAHCNAWGMLAYGGFNNWIDGINANNDLLYHNWGSVQSAYECCGYCVPDHPWMENVDGVRRSI